MTIIAHFFLCASKYDEHSKFKILSALGAPCSGRCSFLLCNEFFHLCLLKKNQIKSNQIKIHNNAKSHALARTKQSPSINVFTQELFTSNACIGNLTLRLTKSCCI